MKRHVELSHLPWYLAPHLACFLCRRHFQGISSLAMHQEQMQHPPEAYLTQAHFKNWVRLMNGLLYRIAHVLHQASITELLAYVQNHPELFQAMRGTAQVSAELLAIIRGWETLNGLRPPDVIEMSPPSTEGCLTWFYFVGHLLKTLPEEQLRVVVETEEERDYHNTTMPMALEPPTRFCDAHFHPVQLLSEAGVSWEELKEQESWSELRERWLIANMVNPSDWSQMAALSQHPEIRFTVGIHPNSASSSASFPQVAAMVQHQNVVGIGETGLDYYRTSNSDVHQNQQRLMQSHCQLARITGLPLVVHCRGDGGALADVQQILQSELPEEHPIMFHSFVGQVEDVELLLRRKGVLVSLGGAILRAQLQSQPDGVLPALGGSSGQDSPYVQVVKRLPLARLLLETDAPHLRPPRLRGEINTPWNVMEIAQFVGRVRNLPPRLVLDIVHHNLARFFRLPL